MRGVGRGLAPIRDAQPGGRAYDAKTLDVHRRQLAAMRHRDPDELDEVLDEHFRLTEAGIACAMSSPSTSERRTSRPRVA